MATRQLYVRISELLMLLSLLILLTTACSPKAQQRAVAPSSVGAKEIASELRLAGVASLSDSLASAYIAAGVTPGISIAVAQHGELVYARGYGKADLDKNIAASPETIYGITSITKQIAAAAIMKLVEQGKVSLNEPVTTYLPDYPMQGRNVTVRHLLNHTSGISAMRSTSSIPDKEWFSKDLTYQQMVKLFAEQPFEFEPGQQRAYNNFAYYLLGEIISRVTGAPYENYIEQKMLQPLGLNHTSFCDRNRSQPNTATAYQVQEGAFSEPPHVSRYILGTAGAMCSTVGELVRWSYLLHNGKVVSAKSLEQMLSPTILANGDTSAYGFGLFLEELVGHKKVFHGGTQPWGSYLAHYPASGLTIAILTNAGGAGRQLAEEMEEKLAREILDVAVQNQELSLEAMELYVGDFVLQAGSRTMDVRIFKEAGKLMAQAAGQGSSPLLYQGNHAFTFAVDDEIRIVFTLENERAEGFTLFQKGRELPAKRKP